jgi:hypothetical protein
MTGKGEDKPKSYFYIVTIPVLLGKNGTSKIDFS